MAALPDQPVERSAEEPAEQPVGRIRFMDQQRVNLDGFAVEDPGLGLVALRAPADPAPSLVIRDGRVTELDGVAEPDFDSIDAYIARHGLDLAVAGGAMSLPDTEFARLLVSPDVPRAEIIRLSAGATPAKLARVLALLRPAELGLAMTKLRGRRTPSNQAHVTNRLDDPLLLAADAATAAAFGFREIETTVPVLADAPSNAVACLIGAAVAAQGVLIQCSVEEALELELGMRGLTSYAETISLYGTEQVFTDGDDTPWSKAFLTSAYASRGMKMRVSSGAGAEVLMAGAEEQVHALPGGPLRGAGPGHRRPGGAERRHRRGQRGRVGARRAARADGREPDGDDAQPGVLLRQRRADERVRHAPHLAHAAHRAGRLGLRVQRVRQHPALRQHVRPEQLQRRGHRRLPGHAAGLGDRRRAAHRAGRADRRAAPRGRAGLPRGVPAPGAGRLHRRARRAGGGRGRVQGPGGDRHAGRGQRGARDPGGRPHRGRRGRRAGRDRLRGRGREDHGHDPGPAVRRLPADGGHLRREPAGAVPGHRPERLRRARAAGTSRRRPGRPRSTPSGRPAASPTCAPSRPPRPPPGCSRRPARPRPARTRGTW